MRGRQTLRSGMAVLLLASVAACMAPQPRLTASPSSMVPLEASIFPPYYGQVPFRVNKPAHVALFEILPGRGVSLLYPTSGSGFTQVAENWVPLQYSAQRWLYASNSLSDPGAGQWSGFDYGYGMGYGPVGMRGMSRTSAPRYLFLVASEQPIEISQFQHNLASMRQFLGANQYSSYQPYNIMEKLAYAVVPYANDDLWVTDVFVDWGYDWGYGYTPGTSASSATWVTMRCADGSVGMARYIPGWGYDMMSCAPWASSQQNPTPGDTATRPGQGGAQPGKEVEGRGRAGGSAQEEVEGRGRAGGASARPRLQGGEQSAETRSRIAQLREDAARSQFNDLLNQQVRQNVELRHRSDEILGRRPGGAMGSSNSNAGRQSAAGGSRTRSRAGDEGSRANAGRSSTQSSEPRSRSGSTGSPRTSTQSSPSSAPPRSREPSSPPTPPSAPPPRSRPPA